MVKLMNFSKHYILLLIIVTGFIPSDLLSQDNKPKPTRQSSIEAYSRGDYEKAYGEFNELLRTYSKDPLYKYYAAACLVNLEREPEQAVTLMNQALENNTAARPLPDDALFVLARAQQLNGDFETAADTYNRYTDQVGKKNAREQGVPEFIQQCLQQKGAAEKVTQLPEEKIDAEIKPAVAAPVAPATVVKKESVVENTLPQKELLAENYSALLDEALDFQYMADSVNALIADQKQQMDKLPNDKKAAARTKIAGYERIAAGYQKSADQKYTEAHGALNPEEKQASVSVQAAENQKTDTQEKIKIPSDTIEIYSYFKVLEKPVTGKDEKIEIDPKVPDGLIYRIQMAVFRNPVSPVYFKGITPVYGFRNEGSELKTYYAGMFRRITDARIALDEIKGKGFKDSFISSFMGKKPVSADRAVVLEKEWGNKPFERTVNKQPVVIPADTLPPTLVFRVEAMRVTKPVKPNVLESMKTLAGSRGMDIITLDDKKIAYLIGNFITFESAAEYADLIVRNGYRDAKVVAWLGTREIPLETAKQLFENLK
jgi:tetratricopeptide (TPR) repeat protein